MPLYFYVLEFVSGLFLTNGVPHFVQGVSGHWFQSPFGYPAGGWRVLAAEQCAVGVRKSGRRIYTSLVLYAARF